MEGREGWPDLAKYPGSNYKQKRTPQMMYTKFANPLGEGIYILPILRGVYPDFSGKSLTPPHPLMNGPLYIDRVC